MDISIYSFKSMSNCRMERMLKDGTSFVLEDIDRKNMSEVVETVEKMIESMGMSCRIYTKGRSAALIAVPVVGLSYAIAALGIHNLATWNPDYELAKNLITGTLTITYKKK